MIYLDFIFLFLYTNHMFSNITVISIYEEYLSFKYRLLLLLTSLTRVMLMIGLCNWLLCKRPSRLENIAIYRILLISLNFSMFCLPWMCVQQMISLHLFASEIFKEMFSKCLSERERVAFFLVIWTKPPLCLLIFWLVCCITLIKMDFIKY